MKKVLALFLILALLTPMLSVSAEQVSLDAIMREIEDLGAAKGLQVDEAVFEISPNGQSIFIDRPLIVGTEEYTIAYNIYDSDSYPVNYFYSDEERVAATPGYAGLFNVFIVVTDTLSGEQDIQNIGWHDLKGPEDPVATEEPVATPEPNRPLLVGDISYEISADQQHIFIDRPQISGGSGQVSIAYNIYDSNSVPVNYFYSDEERVAATPGYDGLFNVFILVIDLVTGESSVQNTGWHEMRGPDAPEPEGEMTLLIDGEPLADGAALTSMIDHVFSWEAVEGADHYAMSADGTTSGVFFTSDTSLKVFFPPHMTSAQLRVMAYDADGEVISFSRSVPVSLYTPDYGAFEAWVASDEVTEGSPITVYSTRPGYLRMCEEDLIGLCGGGYYPVYVSGQYIWKIEDTDICGSKLCWIEDGEGNISNLVSFTVVENTQPVVTDWNLTIDGETLTDGMKVTSMLDHVYAWTPVEGAVTYGVSSNGSYDAGFFTGDSWLAIFFPPYANQAVLRVMAYDENDQVIAASETRAIELEKPDIGAFSIYPEKSLVKPGELLAVHADRPGYLRVSPAEGAAMCGGGYRSEPDPNGYVWHVRTDTPSMDMICWAVDENGAISSIAGYSVTDEEGLWPTSIHGIVYNLIGDDVTVVGYENGLDALQFVDEVNGLPVVAIADEAFALRYNGDWEPLGWPTGELKLPSHLVSVGANAFSDLTGLTGELILPDSLRHVGKFAFWGCDGLTGSLRIPSGLTDIEDGAFGSCHGITGELVLPEGLTEIRANTFERTPFSGALTIPQSVKAIGDYAFTTCTGFTQVSIPEGCLLGTGVFAGTRLTISHNWENSWLRTADGAFYVYDGDTVHLDGVQYGKTSLKIRQTVNGRTVTAVAGWALANADWVKGALILPSTIKVIGPAAFISCTGLSGDLVLPDSLTDIGFTAFAYCTGFSGQLTLPSGIEHLGYSCFAGCTGLNGTVHIPAGCIVEEDVFENTGITVIMD